MTGVQTCALPIFANDLAKMQIESAVSETDIGGVQEGQAVSFTVDAFQNRNFKGKVKQVRFAPTTNQNVVTYTTIVDVDNADLRLRPGMTANVSIVTAEKRGILRVPLSALRLRPPEGVTVIRDTNAPPKGAAGSNAVQVASAGPGDIPTPPWRAQGRPPEPGEREKWEATLTPEQLDAVRKMRSARQMRGLGGEGGEGGGRGFGGPRSGANDGPAVRTAYLYQMAPGDDGKTKVTLKAVTVKTGITDGANFAEVLDGLKEGDVVATQAIQAGGSASATPGSNPFGGSPFGGGMRR